MRVALTGLVVIAAAPGIAHASGFATPPARVDVAPEVANLGASHGYGLHLLAGLHWASLSSDPRTPIDVGIGYVQDQLSLPAPTPAGTITRKSVQPGASSAPLVIHGAYLEVAPRVFGGEHQRAFVGLRVAYLSADLAGGWVHGVGATARASYELFASGRGGGSGFAASGAFAIGVFVEAGVRDLAGVAGFSSSAGLSVRVPLMIAGN